MSQVSPYTHVPLDTLDRMADECEREASELDIHPMKADMLLRRAGGYRAAAALERANAAGLDPYPFEHILEDRRVTLVDVFVAFVTAALIIGAAWHFIGKAVR